MPGDFQSTLGGATSGAMIGSSFAPGIGTLIGAGVGGLAGGLFGGTKNYGYSKDELNAMAQQRYSQIAQFNTQLQAYESNYQQRYTQLAQNTMQNFFGPNAISQLGGMGFSPNSGAVASELARQSIPLQLQGVNNLMNYQMQGANWVSQAQDATLRAQMGFSGASGNMSTPSLSPFSQALSEAGGIAGNINMARNMGYNANPFNSQGGGWSNPFAGWFGGSSAPQNNSAMSYMGNTNMGMGYAPNGLFGQNTSLSSRDNALGITPVGGSVGTPLF